MNQVYVNNVAEIEGIKMDREKYPNRKGPVYQYLSSQDLWANLNPSNSIILTDRR
ncbi:TPA: hypothetical protein QCS32_005850 [Bacillus thuringiensis]|uniref:hypothetical protein n=1 Tax=Bacillus thuringiensis TaxID=1428 RepID=UPI001593453B|nr:hypothetical protein [Bacillus thuringiensis]MEB9623560.1 hypothetical protein [Bacillus cereus]HDR5354050.1 hypothetical protein [Bacillus thuringiensis]